MLNARGAMPACVGATPAGRGTRGGLAHRQGVGTIYLTYYECVWRNIPHGGSPVPYTKRTRDRQDDLPSDVSWHQLITLWHFCQTPQRADVKLPAKRIPRIFSISCNGLLTSSASNLSSQTCLGMWFSGGGAVRVLTRPAGPSPIECGNRPRLSGVQAAGSVVSQAEHCRMLAAVCPGRATRRAMCQRQA